MAGSGPETGFCPECQTDVEVARVSMGTQGIEEARCTICGSTVPLDSEAGSVGLGGLEFQDDSISVPTMNKLMVVGYNDRVERILTDQLNLRNMAREIVTAKNGEEMIIKVIQDLQRGFDNEISLIMLDVPMPFLNGINAAIGLRVTERSYSNHKLIPLLFLTRKPCDDTFKKVIKFLAPAKYAGLGPSEEPAELVPRLSKVVALISKEKW